MCALCGFNSPASANSPLPTEVEKRISDWQDRLDSAACLHVVATLRQSWRRLDSLDERGAPKLTRLEEFQLHSWMTPDTTFMTIYPAHASGQSPDQPIAQMYWNRGEDIARVRSWISNEGGFKLSRVAEGGPSGPNNIFVEDCRSCVYAVGMYTWLDSSRPLRDRTIAKSIALTRPMSLSVLPHDDASEGIWLDVFRDRVVYDTREEPDRIYRRNDTMLLAQGDEDQAEVSEWRTHVMTGSEDGSGSLTRITAVRKFEYQFFDKTPQHLLDSIDDFVQYFDEAWKTLVDESLED